MNKQDELNKKLFNRLFLKMSTVRRIKQPIKIVKNIKLDKSIRYVYYSKETKMWFAHSENKTKFIYFFGFYEGHITNLNDIENFFMLDFDKNSNINNHSLGIINNADTTVHINKELLEEKYPNNNFNNFQEHILTYFERSQKIEITTINLGKLYGNFIINLELLMKNIPEDNILNDTSKSNNLNENQSINLFLNSVKAGKSYDESLKIAKINSSTIKKWYKLGKSGNESYIDFYNTYSKIMPRDENTFKKMNIFLESLKSGKTEEESLSDANVTLSDLKKWINNGKKGELEFIDFYDEYKPLNKIKNDEKKIKSKQSNQELIQSYITLINEGKTNKEAFETLNIPRFKTKNWKQQGQLGNKEYKEFYETYLKAVEREKQQKADIANKENQKLIQSYITLINEGKTNKEAFETLNIPRFKTKNWKQQDQLGNKEYKEFYETYLKAVKREEFEKINQFIELVNSGKSNEEAIEIIRIPEFKLKQWFNNGKNGDEEYIDFYKTYMNQYETTEKIVPTSNPKPTVSEETESNENKKTCEMCGRTISSKSTSNLCKRCKRKQHCANILQKLLQSIEPEVPFKKEDLKRLGYKGIQLQDSIWTLQEFSLIKKEKNNKFSLVNKEILDNFIEESGVEIIETETPSIKLTKKCETCGEILEISKFPVNENNPDGYEDNCKNCKKLITTAGYLKELLTYVTYEQEFNEDELSKFLPDSFLRQAKIWSLQDNDLITKNLDTNSFKLANKDKCETFIEKYFKEITNIQHEPETIESIPKTPETPILTEKQKQMEIVLNARREGKSRKEAAKVAGISLYKITHWFKEGRDGFGEDNTYFYNELKNIETEISKKLKKDMQTVLKTLKSGGSVSEAINKASITEEEFNSWIKKGKNDIKPYKSFLKQYTKYVKKSTDFNDESNIKSRKKFLKYIREGKTRKDASEKASIELKLLDSWIIKGTKGQKPYDEFYQDYKEARKESKTHFDSNQDQIKKEFIELLEKGYTLGEGSRQIENGKYAKDIKKWYVAGKKGVRNHIKFYLSCQKAKNKFKGNKNKIFTLIADGFTIKQACEKLNLDSVKIKNEILKGRNGEKPYDEFYSDIINSKTSLIDIKQLFESGNHPHKDQMIDVLDLLLIGKSENEALETANIDETTFKYWINRGKQQFGKLYAEFYEIYNQIKSGDLIKKYKKEIEREILNELEEIENNSNKNILELLPKKIRQELDALFKESFTGFGWVNKSGNLWFYSRRINGRNIKITDINIRNLHKKVINNNLMWGVRDLEKAKETLRINDSEVNMPDSSAKDILTPLSEDIKTKFSKGTKTGFAWVNKVGNYFYYIRSNKNIRIKSSTIEELYQKVMDNNLDWGVIDIKKAKQTLNIKTPNNEPETEHATHILTPLPEEIENELKKYSKGTSTGFAWVSKNGSKYSYTKVHNDKEITIREYSIQELYNKVIEKNLPWGVRDFEKAKKTLNEKIEPPITKNIINPKSFSKDIYAPFPKEYEDFFKSTPKNKSGIAWVSKVGNRWCYKRQIDGKQLEIYDNNIFKLHKKVIKQNQLWGIRDYEKAKISLLSKPIEDNDYILKETTQKMAKSYPNNTGFALVNKVGSKFEYARNYNGEKLSDASVFGLYEKIMDKNLIWGVIDISEVKKTIGIENIPDYKFDKENKTKLNTSNNSDDINLISDDIFAPLPEQYEDSFKSVSMNKTGIAWVNKTGDFWTYNRQINGKNIKITDEDIYKLHEKVINQNLIWGIRDYDLAKVVLNEEFSDIEDILKPLPFEFKKQFKPGSSDSTGFAWVRKYGSNWYYINNIDNEQITIKDEDLQTLHEKVIKQNLPWGVRNLKKANESLHGISPDKKLNKANIIYENQINAISSKLPNIEIIKKIPNKVFNEFKEEFEENESGFAWVEKVNDTWIYERNLYGNTIKLKYGNFFKLFDAVKINNYDWGIIDPVKAKQTIYKVLEITDEPIDINIIKNDNAKNQKILSPISQKLKHYVRTDSGFALVTKNNNNWEYNIFNSNEKIVDKTINGLYEKVIDNGLLWGVTDIDKAKKTLKNDNSSTNKSIENIEKNTSNDILAPLPKEVNQKLKSLSKGTSTGFAWVIKTGNKYAYKKRINNEIINIEDTNIYELHEKVIKQNHLWGVRNKTKAKQTLAKNKRKTNRNPNEVINTNILGPLPDEFKEKFKSKHNNQTGIAWVNKTQSGWQYSRSINGTQVVIRDKDIYKLHSKVIKHKLTWGVLDIERAKQTISNKSVKTNKNENNNDNILKPLPLSEERKLRKNSKNNTSGFAWVSKIGDKWQYTKIINGTPIYLRDSDIYKLHEIVIKNNYLWGVRDLAKAKQTLKECNKKLPEPPKIDKIPENTVQKSLATKSKKINKDILAPLPKEYEASINHSPADKSGIAWVTKVGNLWTYSRNIDGEYVKITAGDIYKLHKKVINNNMIWGIRDYDKAKELIFNAQPTEVAPKKSEDESLVVVTLNKDIISIEGKIKNNDVLKVLTKIYEFGENILKMNTEKQENETSISIELKLNVNQINEFGDKIKDFGWKIIK